MIKAHSETGYSYSTIKLTQSRIDKGLLAIPKALTNWFPKENTKIQVFIDDNIKPERKNYTSYRSKSHECRIGGLAEWYNKNGFIEGDEIVVQLVDKNNFIYRLIPESKYIVIAKELQNKFDVAKDENEAKERLINIVQWNDVNEEVVKYNEFKRLLYSIEEELRKTVTRKEFEVSEKAPSNIKLLLGKIYFGHCQVCDFCFLKKDLTPYYEIHHINRQWGDQINNLLLVCGNCHNQFTYANVEEEFKDKWLSHVRFNGKLYEINQIVFSHKFDEPTKNVFVS
ncbi:HNH endonuclease [candidate division TA06 bacterium]|uniref:HNH endonuclease n=1 Tax=candidate division TA06 bacterium TaxID=2250710 RepID=A0A933I817_UNCT6|nr:HNH endonuclease [candidate division TA06 bacterium]